MTGPRNAALASEIRAELGRQEMSRRQLARLIGKPDTTVARWLRNDTAMDADDVDAIAVALNMTGLDLMRRAYAASPPFADGPHNPLPGAEASSGCNSRNPFTRLIRPARTRLRNVA